MGSIATVQFYYRLAHLHPSKEQTLLLESFFGMMRMITNHLTLQTKLLNDTEAAKQRFIFEECEALCLRYINDSDFPMMDHISPAILRSMIIAWISEWEDFREKRTKRPEFKTSKDVQQFWILESGALRILGDSFSFDCFPDQIFTLPPSRIQLPRKTTACYIQRNAPGVYQFVALYEQPTLNPHPAQDEVITQWGEKIRNIENEINGTRRHYLMGNRRKPSDRRNEHRLMLFRKIILARLIRQREEKLKEEQEKYTF